MGLLVLPDKSLLLSPPMEKRKFEKTPFQKQQFLSTALRVLSQQRQSQPVPVCCFPEFFLSFRCLSLIPLTSASIVLSSDCPVQCILSLG